VHRIVSCLTWDKAARKRLSRLAVRPVRIEQLSLYHFGYPILDSEKC
jgi:hypothetical protein